MHYFGIKNNYKMAGLNDKYNDEKYVVIKKTHQNNKEIKEIKEENK